MKSLLVLIPLLTTLTVVSQTDVGIVTSNDSFVEIYTSPNTESEAIGTIHNRDLVYLQLSDSSDWYKVITLKWSNGQQLIGFMPKHCAQLFKELSFDSQKAIIDSTLHKHQKNCEAMSKIVSKHGNDGNRFASSKDSLEYRNTTANRAAFSDSNYDPILQVLPEYYCTTKDKETLLLFLNVMWSDRGSANEMPSFTIGDCFMCNPKLTSEILMLSGNSTMREIIADNIHWGLINHFSIDENEVTDNQEFLNFKTQLEKLK